MAIMVCCKVGLWQQGMDAAAEKLLGRHAMAVVVPAPLMYKGLHAHNPTWHQQLFPATHVNVRVNNGWPTDDHWNLWPNCTT
jgi:hypothetical protein